MFDERLADRLAITEHVSALQKNGEGKSVGFSESPRDGRVTDASLKADGELAFQVQGTSPQNEAGAIESCRVLVRWLNRTDCEWAEPTEGTDDVDAEAAHLSAPDLRLLMQVVRASSSQDVWRDLGQKGTVQRNVTTNAAADQMRDAIMKKSKHTPPERRGDLVLVLDASSLPGYAFDGVRESFSTRYRDWAKAQGFKAVCIVGPHEDLVGRLDE